MEEFKSKRKSEILLYAVDEFIKTPQPITSAGISKKFNDVSTATLRNELNALEQMGYLMQLHTSGGRVPTNLAYRYYVNNILTSKSINPDSINKIKDNYETKSVSLISTLTSLARRLSRATNCPTVLVQTGLENLTIVDIKIIPLIQKDALLLVETVAGIIDDNISLPPDVDRETVEEASSYLTCHFRGKTIKNLTDSIAEVCMRAGAQMYEFKTLLEFVATSLQNVVKTKLDVTNENPAKMLNSITKYELDETKDILEFLEDDEGVLNAIDTDKFNFKIGEETEHDKLKGGMVMSAPIVIDGVNIGSLALVGPKRIDYSSLATALKFIVGQAENLNKKENDFDE